MSNKPKVKKNINAKAKEEAKVAQTKEDRKERRARAQRDAQAIKNRNKKAREQSRKEGKRSFAFIEYFRGVRLEMRKVVWPTRKELGSFTVVVIATCAVFALLFWGLDTGVLAAIQAICF